MTSVNAARFNDLMHYTTQLLSDASKLGFRKNTNASQRSGVRGSVERKGKPEEVVVLSDSPSVSIPPSSGSESSKNQSRASDETDLRELTEQSSKQPATGVGPRANVRGQQVPTQRPRITPNTTWRHSAKEPVASKPRSSPSLGQTKPATFEALKQQNPKLAANLASAVERYSFHFAWTGLMQDWLSRLHMD